MKERFLQLVKEGKTNEQILKTIKSENNGIVKLAKAADKLTLPQRRRFVKSHLGEITKEALNPVRYTAWTSADQPIQYLKASKDYQKAAQALRTGHEYKSSISVDLDATCSGIQVYAMMFRDVSASHGVNVSPSDCVQDIYGTIATEMCSIIEKANAKVMSSKLSEWVDREEKDEKMTREVKLQSIKELGESFLNRNHTKRIVMTLTYGLTNFGILEYSQEAVEKIGEDKFTYAKAAKMAFAKIVTQALGKAADCAVRGMLFTQKIAKYCASNNIGMAWTTPSGFKAFRATEGVEETKIQLKTSRREKVEDSQGNVTFTQKNVLDKIYDYKKTGQLSGQKMSSAVAPDLVHSLDASWLMESVNKASNMGVTKFKLVHDSFGTTAANIPKLNMAIREAAVEISQGNYFMSWAVEVTKSEDWEECKQKVNEWKEEEDFISDEDVTQGTFSLEDMKESVHIFS